MKSKTWEVGQEAGKVFGEEYFFVVNPLTINQKLFEKKRRNKEQEELRYWIQLAFEEVEAEVLLEVEAVFLLEVDSEALLDVEFEGNHGVTCSSHHDKIEGGREEVSLSGRITDVVFEVVF